MRFKRFLSARVLVRKKKRIGLLKKLSPALMAFWVGLVVIPKEILFADYAEGNASEWAAFASDGAAASVFDDSERLRIGAYSVRFETQSGFDTGVRFPKAGNAHINASGKTHLIFWSYAVNSNSGFQGSQPIIVI